ncbi:hypothetical protein AURDEDRAFT_163626 [Auricularia subglabra TFB-10046 SS5]|nr:hypothetical protein AURDEDRAFT_163626 [Auricularia subglabra TFB-10046 SS5]
MSSQTRRPGGALAYGRSRKPALLTLPDELLSEIFEISVSHTPAHHLSAVCGQLRTVALRTPRLWSTIRFARPELVSPKQATWEYETLCLKRSRIVPLSIHIDWIRSVDDIEGAIAHGKPSRWLARSDVLRVLGLLWPHVQRICVLSLHCDLHLPFTLLAETFAHLKAPKLQNLDLALHAPYDAAAMAPLQAPLPLFQGGMPELTRVSVQGVCLDWDNTPIGCKSLKSLALSYLPLIEQAVARTIDSSPGLEELIVLSAATPPDHVDETLNITQTRASTSALRSLAVDQASAGETLRLVPLGGLRTIVLTHFAHLPHAPIFASTNITYLTLNHITAAPSTVVEFLRVGFVGLRSLTLNEVRGTPEVLYGIARRGAAVCPKLARFHVGGDVELEDLNVFLGLRERAGVGIRDVSFAPRTKTDGVREWARVEALEKLEEEYSGSVEDLYLGGVLDEAEGNEYAEALMGFLC